MAKIKKNVKKSSNFNLVLNFPKNRVRQNIVDAITDKMQEIILSNLQLLYIPSNGDAAKFVFAATLSTKLQ